jgi:hypothetical protein
LFFCDTQNGCRNYFQKKLETEIPVLSGDVGDMKNRTAMGEPSRLKEVCVEVKTQMKMKK